MTLDFPTLYIIILLNSVIFCIVWAGFVFAHKDIPGARLWLAANLSTTLGGLLLSGDGTAYGRAFCIAGNVTVVFGFGLMWSGIRVFYGKRPKWGWMALALAAGLLAMLVAGPQRPGQNIAYALAQTVPMTLALVSLVRSGRDSLGAGVALVAIIIALSGQLTEVATNALRLMGYLSTDGYYSIAAYLLVAVIYGASLWNLGFLLMAVDRLHDKLAALALYDDLTRLPNRRSFLELAEQELKAARSGLRALALFMIDLDRFKGINDSLGHAAGDACLRHFARVATDVCIRRLGTDSGMARLGGDEFGLVILGLDAPGVEDLAKDLVRSVAAADFSWRDRPVFLSVSIGVAGWHGLGGVSVPQLIEHADAALYETKRRGRNGYTLRPLGAPLVLPAAAAAKEA